MPTAPFRIRHAAIADANAAAEVYPASFRMLSFLPMLHTVTENRWFIANVIFKNCEVMLAEDNSGVVSFPAHVGRA